MLKKVSEFLNEYYVILIILFIGATLRIVDIANSPPSLNWDEVSHGYNAFSILNTGSDEWGVRLPSIFRAYGDYKLPIYIYLTAASELIFGVTAFSVRLPSAIAGVATILFTYLLVKELIGKKVAIVSSLLVAVEPWSLFLSRGAFEANLSLAFIVSGAYFFFRGLKKHSLLIVSGLLFGISIWTYNSARIFVPLLVMALWIVNRKRLVRVFKESKLKLGLYAAIMLVFIIPMASQMISGEGRARYEWTAIVDEGAINQINEERNSSRLTPIVARLKHNKITYFVPRFLSNWASHFSGDFLFFEGGDHYQFSNPGRGLLYLVNIVFLIIGIITMLIKRDRKYMLILGWFFLGPVASSLTREAPHVLRAITVLPSPMIISAVGFITFWKWVESKGFEISIWKNKARLSTLCLIAYAVVLFASTEVYLGDYFGDYQKKYSWSWQYGYKQVVEYAKANYDRFDKIIVSKRYGEPHEFFLFFWPWDPKSFQQDDKLVRFYQSGWYWVDRFDKFYFVNDWDIPSQAEKYKLESGEEFDCASSKCLLITSPGNSPKAWEKIEIVNFLDGTTAFEIYSNSAYEEE